MPLLTARRFAPLLVTQSLGAFNDNLFKNALVVLILFRVGSASGPSLVALAGGLFILPYVVLSATAGQIADRWEKSRSIVVLKSAEILLMAGAAVAFLSGSTTGLFAVLFGLGVQATFFSPLKYGILPDHLATSELVAGNGLIEAGTFLGILAGTIGGSALAGLTHGPAVVSGLGLAVAGAGLASALLIPKAPPRAAVAIGWNIVGETTRLLASARANRSVWLCALGLSWFWSIGATILAVLPTLVRDRLGADETVFTLMLAFFSVGVGAGSVLCSRLLRGEVSARLVPFAAAALSVLLWDFARTAGHARGLVDIPSVLQSATGWRMLVDLALLAMCGGVYSVPLYAVLQARSERSHEARMVAANNVLNAVAIAVGAVLTAALAALGVGPVAILLAAAGLMLIAAVWIARIIPQETVRALFRWYFTTFHRVVISGLDHLPSRPAVIVVNHQSFLDGCFVAAFLPNAPTFAVNVHIARRWWAKPFLAAVRFFPVDPANPFAAKTMVKVVRGGDTLVIFPEGRITITGALMKVYEGAGLIADKAGVPIVPIRIDGAQYSMLSRLRGRVRRRWFPRLSLTVLPPVMLEVREELLGRARRRAVGAVLQGLMERAAFVTEDTGRTLFAALLEAAARHGVGTAIVEDIARAPLSYRGLLLRAAVLGRRLADEVPAGSRVGVMLPNANAALATFMALQAWERVPAMLNVSAGSEAVLSACAAAEVTIVISSRQFVTKGKLGPLVERMEGGVRFVWLEDVAAGLGRRAKLRGWWDARRAGRLPGAHGSADGAACVLFTSGSEGTPKGVVLSHRNILANIAQVRASIDFNSADRVFNAMPMFHAFGLTGGTLLPLLSGVRGFLYPNPLHLRVVPELVYDTDSTIVFGTDTFLSGWARYAHPYDFHRVRYIVAGAEKLRDETRALYSERFGVRVLEGYGATETAPVLALNTPMHGRPGSAGRLLPGIEYRLDPVAGIEEGGLLVVRGPNVMLGYLRTSAPGVLETPEDGWYDTGDICTVDAEGFVTIVARAKRFAKIGGEMVSMPAAEALAASVWPGAAHAVVSVPDGRKGEALVLLTTQRDAAAGPLLARARAAGAAELAVPRTVRVLEALPLLATGKVDYPAATRMVMEQRTPAEAAQ